MSDASNGGTETLRIDALVEVVIGLLIVRPESRPAWVKTYDDARAYAEDFARRLRGF